MRIRSEKISWLRFVLEGYDGLATLSTLCPATGLVRIQTLDCRYQETMRLLDALAAELTPFARSCPGACPKPTSCVL